MPHINEFHLIEVKELHPTFGAEITGVDFSEPVSDEVFTEIFKAITKYGVCGFRHAGLDDKHHVEFAARFGELDDIKPYIAAGRKHRLPYDELFDVSNLDDDGAIADPTTRRALFNKGNSIFHVDSSFNPRRAGFSLLRAHELPPQGTGGNTEYADTRQAFADLPLDVKNDLVEQDYIAAHSLWHSRKFASPELVDIHPENFPMSRHKLVQPHVASGRMNLYIASHIHHIEGLSPADSEALFKMLYTHATQPKYVVSIDWQNNGDLILWDNTCVMHRAMGGSYEGKYVRDMRRATVHDGSPYSWGLNEKVDTRQGYP